MIGAQALPHAVTEEKPLAQGRRYHRRIGPAKVNRVSKANTGHPPNVHSTLQRKLKRWKAMNHKHLATRKGEKIT